MGHVFFSWRQCLFRLIFHSVRNPRVGATKQMQVPLLCNPPTAESLREQNWPKLKLQTALWGENLLKVTWCCVFIQFSFKLHRYYLQTCHWPAECKVSERKKSCHPGCDPEWGCWPGLYYTDLIWWSWESQCLPALATWCFHSAADQKSGTEKQSCSDLLWSHSIPLPPLCTAPQFPSYEGTRPTRDSDGVLPETTAQQPSFLS